VRDAPADVEDLVATVEIGMADIGGVTPARARKAVLRASSLPSSVEASGGAVVLRLLRCGALKNDPTVGCRAVISYRLRLGDTRGSV